MTRAPERAGLTLGAVAVAVVVLALSPKPDRPDPFRGLPVAERVSWTTYGFDTARSGYNPSERTLGPSNVGDLHLAWRIQLDGVSITSPVVAADVPADGRRREVAYVGTERGTVEAVDVSSGRVLWRHALGRIRIACSDTPHGVYGVSGTPAIDESAGLLYAVGSDREGVWVHALDLATGAEAPGWPVSISDAPTHMHVWGAVTLSRGLVYAAFAGMCDIPPYYGKVAAVDQVRARVVHTWFAVREGEDPVGGGGIWGFGGVSADPVDGSVYAATGNALPPNREDYSDGESIVRLTRNLVEVAAHKPEVGGYDVDFGATPMLFRTGGCPPQLVVANKAGGLYLYDRERIAHGPVQRFLVAQKRPGGLGLVIGVAAFWPRGRMVYFADPGPDRPPFRHGLLAFREGLDCRLFLAWQQTVGPNATSTLSSPTVANGVVYFADGDDHRVLAFDARTGLKLWEGGGTLGGPIFAPPVVVNGRLLVASWEGDGGGALSAYVP